MFRVTFYYLMRWLAAATASIPPSRRVEGSLPGWILWAMLAASIAVLVLVSW